MSQKELETIAAVVAQRLKGMQERQDEQLAALKDRIRLLESTLLRSDVGAAAVDECQVPPRTRPGWTRPTGGADAALGMAPPGRLT